jgi:type IV secretory pathway TrbL component
MNELLFQKIELLVRVPEREAFESHGRIKMLGAKIGITLHWPLYRWISNRVRKKTRGTVFFDSVVFSVLMFMYPLYLLLLSIILFWIKLPLAFVVIIILLHPISAFCAVRFRRIN